jgi:hypothetical protein
MVSLAATREDARRIAKWVRACSARGEAKTTLFAEGLLGALGRSVPRRSLASCPTPQCEPRRLEGM